MTIYYTSNNGSTGFDVTTSGTLPSSWASKTGTWQVGTTQLVGSHTRSFGSTTHGDGDAALLTGISAVADMQVSFSQKIPGLTATMAPMLGVLLRMDTGYANGYAILVDQTGTLGALRFLLFKRVGGSFTFLSSSSAIAGITFASTDTVTLRAQAQGTTISMKLWPTRIAEPAAWQFSATDSAITAAGYCGLYYALDGAGAASMAVTDVVVSDLPAVVVATPGTMVAGGAMTVSGTYAGQDPPGLNFQFDSAGYSAAASPTIAAGAFSFTATAPAAGSHTVSVQETNNTAITGTSGSFTTATGAVTVTTPGGVLSGQSMTVSGTYSGAVPSGLNYRFDSAGYVAASGATIGGGTYSFTVIAPGFGPHTVSVQEANATSITATSGGFSANVAPNDAAIAYSPYNWNIQSTAATTANAGAYLRVLFTGGTCALAFDVTAMASPATQIWWRIDNGPWTQATLAASIACTVPAATAGNADVPYHLLEVVVKAMTETQNRWNAGTSTRLVFTGIGLAAGAAVLAPLTAPLRVLAYGDSITEGVRTLGETAASDTDRNDAAMGWAYRLGALLGAEVGVVGFGAQGLSVAGSGNVPVLGSSWNAQYAGASRGFSAVPDLVVINIGTNDGATNTVVAMTALLNNLISTCPARPIAVLRPFNGAQAANLQAAIAACSNPAACRWVDTTGFFNTAFGADALNLHPSGPNNTARVAPLIAAALRPFLAGGGAPGFRAGFQRSLLG